jgi:hypothetical protein
MRSQVQTIIRRVFRDPQKLNVLVMPTHERYETGLARTGHSFYAYRAPGIKDWNTNFAPVPPNYTLLNPNKGEYQIPPYVDIDLVLSQNKECQFNVAKKIAMQLGVPFVSMEHTLPYPGAPAGYIQEMRSRQADIDVFVTEFNREAWGFSEDYGEINHTGLDTDLFCPDESVEKREMVLTVANDFINRDNLLGYKLWQQTTGHPNTPVLPAAVVGDTKGLSSPAKTTEELVTAYRSALVYLNTTLWSSLPTVIMEAMACEVPVVTTGTTLIPKLMVKHGYNGFISKDNDPEELRGYCIMLLRDKELRETMGRNARQSVIENFSEQRFIDKWNEIFARTVGVRR